MNKPPDIERMELTLADRQTSLWIKLMRHFEQRIEEHHRSLERTDMSEQHTAVYRGRIAELRLLQSRNEQPQIPVLPPQPPG